MCLGSLVIFFVFMSGHFGRNVMVLVGICLIFCAIFVSLFCLCICCAFLYLGQSICIAVVFVFFVAFCSVLILNAWALPGHIRQVPASKVRFRLVHG